MKLDLASGAAPAEGYDGVDVVPLGQPWVVDLTRRPWPWETSSVEAARCSHYVEHIVDLIGFMNEAWRVLAPGALFEITHPYAWSNRAWQDPTHVRALVEESWYYYDAGWRAQMGLAHYPITANFSLKSMDYVLSADWAARREDAIRRGGSWNPGAVRNGVNIVDDLHVVLEALK